MENLGLPHKRAPVRVKKYNIILSTTCQTLLVEFWPIKIALDSLSRGGFVSSSGKEPNAQSKD
jgi:hypothetical protein